MFASTADEQDSLDFLIELGIPFIKVGSGDIGNISFLRYIGAKKMPVILSTGMSTLVDVEKSLSALRIEGASDITILHCTTNYPCPFNEVNLMAMKTLENAFGLPVGYSDHTVGSEVPIAAVALGARVLEKHFTLDKNMKGPDHIASTEPDEFKRMVMQIRHLENAMGDGIKRLTVSEKAIKSVVTKRIVARKPIKKGETITEEKICVKRSDEGETADHWDELIGKKAIRDFESNQGIFF